MWLGVVKVGVVWSMVVMVKARTRARAVGSFGGKTQGEGGEVSDYG